MRFTPPIKKFSSTPLKVGRLIVGCECSGRVRDAFRVIGWDAWNWVESLVLLPKDQRATERIRTFMGIANAMANQWGALK